MPKTLTEKTFSRKKVIPFFCNSTDIQGYYKYRDNVLLSSSLHTPLHVFEVTLRNVLNLQLENWRSKKNVAYWNKFLKKRGIDETIYSNDNEQKTLRILSSNLKKCRRTEFPTLGFYTRLTSHSNANIFSSSIIIPMLESLGFTDSVTQGSIIRKMQRTFPVIQKLRNRICHYESIVTVFTERELKKLAEDMYEFIQLLNPEAYQWISIEYPLTTLKYDITHRYRGYLTKTLSPILHNNN